MAASMLGEVTCMSGMSGNGFSGEGEGVAKEKVNTADTPARPGVNSLENAEPDHQSHIDRIAEDSAKRAMNREAHIGDGQFTK